MDNNTWVIASDGELYHWSWKKVDHKYIKRERKNGRWVYTYPSDKGDNSGKGTFSKSGSTAKADSNTSNKSFWKSMSSNVKNVINSVKKTVGSTLSNIGNKLIDSLPDETVKRGKTAVEKALLAAEEATERARKRESYIDKQLDKVEKGLANTNNKLISMDKAVVDAQRKKQAAEVEVSKMKENYDKASAEYEKERKTQDSLSKSEGFMNELSRWLQEQTLKQFERKRDRARDDYEDAQKKYGQCEAEYNYRFQTYIAYRREYPGLIARLTDELEVARANSVTAGNIRREAELAEAIARANKEYEDRLKALRRN